MTLLLLLRSDTVTSGVFYTTANPLVVQQGQATVGINSLTAAGVPTAGAFGIGGVPEYFYRYNSLVRFLTTGLSDPSGLLTNSTVNGTLKVTDKITGQQYSSVAMTYDAIAGQWHADQLLSLPYGTIAFAQIAYTDQNNVVQRLQQDALFRPAFIPTLTFAQNAMNRLFIKNVTSQDGTARTNANAQAQLSIFDRDTGLTVLAGYPANMTWTASINGWIYDANNVYTPNRRLRASFLIQTLGGATLDTFELLLGDGG